MIGQVMLWLLTAGPLRDMLNGAHELVIKLLRFRRIYLCDKRTSSDKAHQPDKLHPRQPMRRGLVCHEVFKQMWTRARKRDGLTCCECELGRKARGFARACQLGEVRAKLEAVPLSNLRIQIVP